jgi:diguanylate cyclase (GGDEF)-like protein/PAS domain S-box-containing protein
MSRGKDTPAPQVAAPEMRCIGFKLEAMPVDDKLRQSPGFLKLAEQIAGLGGWALDLQDNRLLWSSELCKILGYSSGALPSLQDALSICTAESRRIITSAIAGCRRDGTPVDCDLNINTAQGYLIRARMIGHAIIEDGEVVRIEGAFRNLTQEKPRDHVLTIEMERLERAEAQAQLGSWEFDVAGQQRWWSAQMCRLLYFNPAEGIPAVEDYLAHVHREDRGHILEALRSMANGELPIEREFRTNPEAGPMRYLMPTAAMEVDAEGRPARFTGTVRDVTRQRQAEAVHRQNERLLDIASRAARLGGWSFDLESNKIDWSDEMCEIHGLPPGTSPSVDAAFNFVTPEHRTLIEKKFTACVQHGVPFDEELTIVDTNGQRHWVRSIARPIRDQWGVVVGVQGAFQDITAKKESEAEIHRLNNQIVQTLETITDAFVTLDKNDRFTYLNREAERVLERSRNQLLGRNVWDEYGDALGTLFEQEYHRAVRDQCTVTFQEFLPSQNIWLDVRTYPSDEGVAIYFRDLSEHKQAEKSLHEAQERTRLIIETALDAIVTMDCNGRIIGWNKQAELIFGWSADEVIGRILPETVIPERYREKHRRGVKHFFATGEGILLNRRIEISALHRDGHEFPVELAISVLKSQGEITFSAFIRDITERKHAEREISNLAFYDPLTDLPNRRLLEDQLHHAVAASVRQETHGALLFIDLDNFKTLNDTLGHHIGDLLLQEVARRLLDCVRESDTVARFAGDEFVVILENLDPDKDQAITLAMSISDKIRRSLDRPYGLQGHERHSTASIGITLFGKSANTTGELMKQADLALYQAKSAGRNKVHFFDPQAQIDIIARAGLETLLREALGKGEMLLYYQPQIDSHGALIGAEVLLRWNNDDRGEISPAEFIPLAESSGLIQPIGDFVLDCACRQLALFAKDPATANFRIAVNISARQFHHPDFVERVRQTLDQTDADPSRLKLELTETVLLDDIEDTIIKMTTLKIEGVSFSLDDFGTGYSSLYYLKRLPLDELKIDQGFVRDVYKDPNDAAIVRAILVMAKSLGLHVIAEGVETEDSRRFLDRNGCRAYQGHLFSRPLPINQFQSYIQQHRAQH